MRIFIFVLLFSLSIYKIETQVLRAKTGCTSCIKSWANNYRNRIENLKTGEGHIFFEWAKKSFFKKKQIHKFLNKYRRSNGEVAKFSENDLLYDIN